MDNGELTVDRLEALTLAGLGAKGAMDNGELTVDRLEALTLAGVVSKTDADARQRVPTGMLDYTTTGFSNPFFY
jgi:hypothetical protein